MLRLAFVTVILAVGTYWAFTGGPFYTLLLYLWYAYFRPESWVWDSELLVQLRLSLFVGVLLVLHAYFGGAKFVWNRRLTWIAVFTVHSCLSTVLGEFVAFSYSYWIDFLKFAVVITIMLSLVTDVDRLRLVLLVIALSLGVMEAKQGLIYLVTRPEWEKNDNEHFMLGDANGVALGMLMLVSVFTLLARTARQGWPRYLYWGLMLGVLFRALTSYSRAAFLGAACMGLAYLVRSKHKFQVIVGSVALIVVMLPALPETYWDRMETIISHKHKVEEEEDRSITSRFHFWEVAVNMANEHPVFGVGYNAYIPSYNDYDFTQGRYGKNRSVHSMYFGVLAELGYVGLALYLAVLFQAFRSCHRVRKLASVHAECGALAEYAFALETGLLAFCVGGAFAPAQYVEMLWHFIGLTIVVEEMAKRKAAAAVPRKVSQQEPAWRARGRLAGASAMKSLSGFALVLPMTAILLSGCALFEPAEVLPPPVWEPMVSAPPFCPPLPTGQAQRTVRIKAGDVEGLMWATANSRAGTDIVLEDGRYQLTSNRAIEVLVPRVSIRSASGNRDAVIIEGGAVIVSIFANDVTVADLTISGAVFHNIQVHGESGVTRTRIYNVHLLDAGQQLIKVSAGDARNGKFADDGLVACSLIEYSKFNRGSGVTPPDYTNGVDVLAGKGWVIRDNVFRRIRSAAGPAGPAVLVWKGSTDTVVVRNKIVDCWRGIALGLSTPDAYSRGGPASPIDHQNGLVENNVILALREPADAAIENNFAVNSRVLHNTVYYREDLKHPVNWSIEYRFSPTTAVIQNNLTNLPILKRQPAPRQEAVLQGNLAGAQGAWFRDVMAEDLRLAPGSPAINQGVAAAGSELDFAGTKRPVGAAPDVGAFEFVEAGNASVR